MTEDIITLSHGAGGRLSRELINKYVKKYFSCTELDKLEDAARIKINSGTGVITTDSFVISPPFFSGGDIGKLSVCGTINDLSAMGAKPLYLTCGFILEEGLKISDFEKILKSMSKTAEQAGVKIVTGDTKVVQKNKGDLIFINTTGFGVPVRHGLKISASNAKPGDKVIITGNIGEHEIAVLKDREGLSFEADIKSDCAPLNGMIKKLLDADVTVHAMRDPTRGGLAGVLNEIASDSKVNILIEEEKLPVSKTVKAACSIMGFEPWYLANEGKMVIITEERDVIKALKILKNDKYGRKSEMIGEVKKGNGRLILKTRIGGKKVLLMPEGEQLPRIC
ncbi:MAG: hydrogenase expression/formation protein HypE [Candidatus Goldbacteria bacterium]|nr:hydrogenase expression/formation protein HypE [Candidatus Goldiibacteriota bacterium]